jgi:peroxiredoxin
MVLIESKMLPLKSKCPNFLLPSVEEKNFSLKDFADSKALLVAFICNHCPYVRAIEERLIELRRLFSLKDLAMVGICSNDANKYPEDGKEALKKRWHERNYGFPYLLDKDQTVAKAFGAVCTPDLFLFDQDRSLFYHGQLDDNWQEPLKVNEPFLKNAINDILQRKGPPQQQKPSMGCSIKWK